MYILQNTVQILEKFVSTKVKRINTDKACPVNKLKRYMSLGSIDITSDHFLFKSTFKSKDGLRLIYKNKHLSYTGARGCLP